MDIEQVPADKASRAIPTEHRDSRSLNDINQEFWDAHRRFMETLHNNLATCRIAACFYRSLQMKVPPLSLPPFDFFLTTADEARKVGHHSLSEKGGDARKSDALSHFIAEWVHRDLKVTEREIIRSLERHEHRGFEIDPRWSPERQIRWTEDGKDYAKPVSGMKDRLSRARLREKKFLALSALREEGIANVFQGPHMALGETNEGSSI